MTGSIGDVRNLGGTQTTVPLENTTPLGNQGVGREQTTLVVSQNTSQAGTSQTVLEPPKPMSLDDMILAAINLRNATMEEQSASSKEQIKSDLAQKTSENNERIKKLGEAIEKMADAKKSGVWGKVFGWIGAIAAAVAAVALLATGVGAVAAGFLIAGAVIGLTMQSLNEAGVMEEWAKSDPNGAAIFGWVMMGVQIALSLASIGVGLWSAGSKAASAAANIAATTAQTAGQAASTTVTVAAQAAATTAQKVATIIKTVAMGVQGVSMIGQGTATIVTAGHTENAEKARADAKDAEAAMLKLQAMLEDELARLKKMLDEMQEGVSIAMQILSNTADTKSTIIQQTSV
ncbi:transloator [Gammaproteobacteria bacterium]